MDFNEKSPRMLFVILTGPHAMLCLVMMLQVGLCLLNFKEFPVVVFNQGRCLF